jgi:hypothetical protein
VRLCATRPSALVDSGFLYIGASGTCTVEGSIVAMGTGRAGATGMEATTPAPGRPGRRASPVEIGFGMSGPLSRLPVDWAITGAGGGGGGADAGSGLATALLARGGDGGGAVGGGGVGACFGCSFPSLPQQSAQADPAKRARLDGGGTGRTDAFASLLLYPGAGGGSGGVGAGGGTGGSGGNGGGVIYLECQSLILSGTIDASGNPGEPSQGDAGGGGGGGGGLVLIRTRASGAIGTINVSGGPGGAGGAGQPGAAGGQGYAKIVVQ